MIRDWAGLDSSSDVVVELDSAGPGDVEGSRGVSAGVACTWSGVEDIGRDDSLRRPVCSPIRAPEAGLPELPSRGDDDPPTSRRTAVLVDVLRDTAGRVDVLSGVPDPLPSLRVAGESRRSDRMPAAESELGTGDGAWDPPFAAAVALRTWARTWEACRSVR